MSADAALGHPFDLARPTRRNVFHLDPVVDDGAVELKSPGDIGLAAENLDQPLDAVHEAKFRLSNCV